MCLLVVSSIFRIFRNHLVSCPPNIACLGMSFVPNARLAQTNEDLRLSHNKFSPVDHLRD